MTSHVISIPILATWAAFFTIVSTSALHGKRIVNGEEAEPLSHPYIASLQYHFENIDGSEEDETWRHFCGGVVVDKNWVLTAAHCVDWDWNQYNISVRVKLGEHHLKEETSWEFSRGVAEVITHPYWCDCALAHDIALLRLDSPIRLGCAVQAATLSHDDSDFVYKTCVLAGWGRYEAGYHNWNGTMVLNEVDVTHIPNDLCASMMKRMMKKESEEWEDHWHVEDLLSVREGNICAFDVSPEPDGEGSACHGDSGGPMMCGEDHDTLVGITSWGNPSCEGPNIYTRVSKYVTWIRRTIDFSERYNTGGSFEARETLQNGDWLRGHPPKRRLAERTPTKKVIG